MGDLSLGLDRDLDCEEALARLGVGVRLVSLPLFGTSRGGVASLRFLIGGVSSLVDLLSSPRVFSAEGEGERSRRLRTGGVTLRSCGLGRSRSRSRSRRGEGDRLRCLGGDGERRRVAGEGDLRRGGGGRALSPPRFCSLSSR